VDREQDRPPPVRDGLVLGAHWGLVTFFVAVGAYYAMSLLLAWLALGGRASTLGLRPAELGPLVLLSFIPNLLLGLVPAFGCIRWGSGLRGDLGILPARRDVKGGLVCGGFALLAAYVLNLLLLGAYGRKQMPDPLGEVLGGLRGETGWLVLTAVILVVVAPLTEELLMRGAMWNGLAAYRVPPWVILVLTSLVFAVLHGEPIRTVALLGQGIAIGMARLLTGGIAASITAHAVNNLPPALLLFAGP
jgi:membrane protease YdiL (CAAX protease family)